MTPLLSQSGMDISENFRHKKTGGIFKTPPVL
jgi:hypothetical protein